MLRNAIRRDDEREVPHVGVERAVEDALFGDLAGDDQVLGLEPAEQIGERAGVERAVTHLEHPQAVVVGGDRRHQVRALAVQRRLEDVRRSPR